jgi:hypothetical protein
MTNVIWFHSGHLHLRASCYCFRRTPRGSRKKPIAGRSPTDRLSTAAMFRGLEKNGMVGAGHGRGMESVNKTRPRCGNQMGKTHSKPLAARHGRGTAWTRHAMCQSALREVPWSSRLGVERWTDFPTLEKSLVTKTNGVETGLMEGRWLGETRNRSLWREWWRMWQGWDLETGKWSP